MKNITARGIILKNNRVILLLRRKIIDNKLTEYYAIPGGHIENNETLEECLIREIKEELNIDVEVLNYLGTVEKNNNIEYIYNCKYLNGKIKLGGEEKEYNNENNYYEIKEVNYNDLDKINLYKENLDIIKKVIEMER